tara:strand:- start:3562 stop:3912 length:351 start_codon:yes stop_codon:yes gene_type:complete
MFKIDASDFQNYIFRKDITGDNVTGGYPINNLITTENNIHSMLGGSNDIGTSRFDGLVVPLGLSVDPTTLYGGCSQLSNIKMINNNEIIDDKIFNELFGKVKHNNDKAKTRKNKKP